MGRKRSSSNRGQRVARPTIPAPSTPRERANRSDSVNESGLSSRERDESRLLSARLHGPVRQRDLGSLSLRLVQLTTRLEELSGGRIESRFARLFLKLADQMGVPSSEGVRIPLALSRQELADLLGTTIETTIRTMSRWGKEDVLRTDKDGFVIVDRAALEAAAGA